MVKAHRFLTLALILHLFSSTAAQQAPWNKVSGGKMTVSMPCSGEWQATKDEDITMSMLICKSGDDTYSVAWVEYTGKHEIQAELKANRDNLLKGTGAVLLTTTDITYQGFPALDFTAKTGTRLITSRVVMIDGSRGFQVTTFTSLGQDRAANIRRFLSSLRITP